MHVYAPPRGAEVGEFITERPALDYQPTTKMRKLKAQTLSDFLQAFETHHKQERLHRAIANYQLALDHLNYSNWVFPAEFLYIATEALAPVIYERVCLERGLNPETGKAELAKILGFKDDGKTTQHLYEVDSWARREQIYDGHAEVYKKLKFASTHLEHSSRDFGQVRDAADIAAPAAFAPLRRAILKEAGLPEHSPLFSEKLDEPIGAWKPALQVRGTYTDSQDMPGPGFERGTLKDDWPQFLGLNLRNYISEVEDNDEKNVRHVQMKLDGDGRSLLDTQSVSITQTLQILPGVTDQQVEQSEPDIKITTADEPSI